MYGLRALSIILCSERNTIDAHCVTVLALLTPRLPCVSLGEQMLAHSRAAEMYLLVPTQIGLQRCRSADSVSALLAELVDEIRAHFFGHFPRLASALYIVVVHPALVHVEAPEYPTYNVFRRCHFLEVADSLCNVSEGQAWSSGPEDYSLTLIAKVQASVVDGLLDNHHVEAAQ